MTFNLNYDIIFILVNNNKEDNMINKVSRNSPLSEQDGFDGLNRFVRRAKSEYFHSTLEGVQKTTAQKTTFFAQKKLRNN